MLVFLLTTLAIPSVGSRAQNVPPLPAEDAAWIAVARDAVRSAVTGSAPTASPVALGNDLPAQGVFVTIERNGAVVGCRGTLRPRFATLRTEIESAARSAATADPRYRPLTSADLRNFRVTVTIIERLEPIDHAGTLALTAADGIALQSGDRTGVVLPWEGRDPATRRRWAYKKAGVPENSPCQLWRVVARRFRG
jgi:AMMECR1 domain-containing protein